MLMSESRTARPIGGSFVALAVCTLVPSVTFANVNVVGRPEAGETISAQNAQEARAPARTLTDPDQLTEKIRAILGLEDGEEAAGSESHPFTTKRASSDGDITPVDKFP